MVSPATWIDVLPSGSAMLPAVAAVIRINRAPVPTLWSALVAERLGFD